VWSQVMVVKAQLRSEEFNVVLIPVRLLSPLPSFQVYHAMIKTVASLEKHPRRSTEQANNASQGESTHRQTSISPRDPEQREKSERMRREEHMSFFKQLSLRMRMYGGYGDP
jgi:hypothetical protein